MNPLRIASVAISAAIGLFGWIPLFSPAFAQSPSPAVKYAVAPIRISPDHGALSDTPTFIEPTLVLTKQVLEENKEPMLQYVK